MWGSNLNFSNWKGEKQEPGWGVHRGWLWCLSQRSSGVIRKGREESKSQLEGVSFLVVFCLFFFKWKQNYGTLSPTEGIFHLLLSDWAVVIYMLN
jgi:hypothetical protein